MKRIRLSLQFFLSILGVALGTAVVVGLAARTALSAAFDAYLETLPEARGMGRGMGRMMLGTAEQTFLANVDRSVIIATLVAVGAAIVVALVLAQYLARPLKKLEAAAQGLAIGDLAHRVEVDGPHEVAALGEAFNVMADSLETAEELRRRLVADVAHELRNPLAAARAQAEGMADGVIRADAARLASIVEDLTHLSALIDDLQELAVAEAGRLRYDMAPLDIVALARREAVRADSLLHRGVSLVLEGSEAPIMVDGDELRLAQVLRNLLSNAARHTQRGTVTVSASLEDGRAVVRVADTGEGMSADDLEHVFERFYRADAARAADTGGAGLGLAISRTIVADHGGEIFAESEPGAGTTMGFRLPLSAGIAASAPAPGE